MAMIEIRGLTRRFGTFTAVDNLDLEVEEGELYGFLGPNGAGKTTCIRILNGLLQPTLGEVRIHGLDYGSGDRTLRGITGLVPDTPPLYDFLTGRQYIGLVASLYGIAPADRDRDSGRLLEAFSLTGSADELCKGYSHGMKKKLHITAVLTTRPKVLFLDEPTTGLDPRSARHLKDILRQVCDDGATVFLSTHILDTAEKVCDRIGILDKGVLKAEGTMEELRSLGGQASLEDIFLQLTDELGEEAAGAAADEAAAEDEEPATG